MTHTNLGTIVLDAGHGGSRNVAGSSANNAVSASGVKEKDLTLALAVGLRDVLLAQAAEAGERLKVVLTRTSDVNVTGARRAGTAARHEAAAFLSVHFNGSTNRRVRGPETFYRARENGNRNLKEDIAFARAVQAGLVAGLAGIGLTGKDRGARPDTLTALGALGILNDARLGSDCVAALCEIEFITNPEVDDIIVSGPAAQANRGVLLAELARALRAHLRNRARQ